MSGLAARLIQSGFTEDHVFDTAVSRAMLLRTQRGELGETFRLHVPGRVVAFGKHDTLVAGYRDAVAAAEREGYAAVERIAGGRAAVFHEETIAFSWTSAERNPAAGINGRFATIANLMVDAFADVGIATAVGEIRGEYCPGAYSVHHAGRVKVMGVGQRLGRGAAYVGGVVVVRRGDLVAAPLLPVYRALGLEWNPATAGSLADADPDVTVTDVSDAIANRLRRLAPLRDAGIEAATLDLAAELAPAHRPSF